MGNVVWDGYDQESAQNNFAAKWYLNGFPKSGLHCAVQFMKPLARLMPPGQLHPLPWVGTFKHNSWSDEWQDITAQLYNLCRLWPGHYFKGHCAWQPEIEHFMWYAGLAHVFIFRDLRDVAVSQAHHILSDDPIFNHPGRDQYRDLGGFDEVLEAVIVGLDCYPGVVDRWRLYAPWLDVAWVFQFRYEDALKNPPGMAERLVQYGLERFGGIFGLRLRPAEGQMEMAVEAMVHSAVDKREESLTFRQGKAGGWMEAFTERHKVLFKETDRDGWLVRLGYEQDDDW